MQLQGSGQVFRIESKQADYGLWRFTVHMEVYKELQVVQFLDS